jgi:transposase InsO family protein
MVDSKKSVHDIMDSLLLTGGDFSCHQRRGKSLLVMARIRRKRLFACVWKSFFSHLKTEKLCLEKPDSEAAARTCVAEYIDYYNNERFQKKLGDLSPVEFREVIAA